MIAELVEYGSVLYWTLLFLGIYLVTIFACSRKDTLRPNLWAGLLFVYVFGFTSFRPDQDSLLMGILAYFIIGAGYCAYKWINLVVRVKNFTNVMGPLTNDDWMLRHLAYEEFKPLDALDNVMTLPPDPYEFRTRLTLWVLYWPSFTALYPVAALHNKISSFLWDIFHSISTSIYERRDKNEG